MIMEHNFILTDIMKTGYNPALHEFLSYQTIPGQRFEFDEQYYRLHFYDLKKYKRKFACLFPRPRLYESAEYCEDLQKRINKLVSLGFKIIVSEPWESRKTIKEKLTTLHIDHLDYIFWAGDASWFWFYMYDLHRNKKFTFDHAEKKFDFFYLNKQSRPHREQLFDLVYNAGLLDRSLYSFTSRGIALNRDYELPWARDPYPDKGLDQDIYELPYNHSAYNIVSETQIDEEIFITEKIWKPIIAEQIFVVHAKPFYLKDLRELGFKTFDGIIDESYDSEINSARRIDKIVELCHWLKQQDWRVLYAKTEHIRKHNAQLFFNKTGLQGSINKTLLGLLKSFNSSQISS
jgi:hypothetical protein